MNDAELQNLLDYQAQMERLAKQPTVVGAPAVNIDTDALQAYAKQFGLMDQQPTVVDPSVDRFDPNGGGQAHSTLDFAIPGTGIDTNDIANSKLGQAVAGIANTSAAGQAPAAADAQVAQDAVGKVTGAGPDAGLIGIANAGMIANDRPPPPPSMRGVNLGPEPQVEPGPPAPFFGPPGGGMYVPPRQVDLLNPTGKDDTNRTEYDAGWNDQFKALGKRNQDLEGQTYDRMTAIDASAQRAQQAYADQRAMLEGQLKAQTDHAAAMANAKQWADSAADAAQKEAADAKVDQGHFFASRGAGQQIALIIGAALGSLGSSLTNTPNYAMQMIQGAMHDDMTAQQANLSNKRASADSALKRAMSATGDLDSAKNIVRLQQLQVAQNQIDSYAKMDLADEQKAKLMEIHDGLKAQILDTRGRMMQDRAIKDMQLRPMVGGGMVGGQGNAGAAGMAKDAIDVPAGVPGKWKTVVVTNPEDRAQIVDESTKYYAGLKIYQQIKAITDKGRLGREFTPQDKAALEALRLQMTLQLKPKQGASSDNDFEQASKAAGDPDAWLSDGTAIMDQYLQNKKTAIDARLKSGRAYPAAGGTTRDAKGNIVPAAGITGAPGSIEDPTTFQDAAKK